MPVLFSFLNKSKFWNQIWVKNQGNKNLFSFIFKKGPFSAIFWPFFLKMAFSHLTSEQKWLWSLYNVGLNQFNMCIKWQVWYIFRGEGPSRNTRPHQSVSHVTFNVRNLSLSLSLPLYLSLSPYLGNPPAQAHKCAGPELRLQALFKSW